MAHEAVTMRLPSVFISYSHADNAAPREQVAKLESHLRLRKLAVARDDSMLQAGDDWEEQLEPAATSADVFVACVSDKFLHSDDCLKELAQAQASKRRIVPVLIRTVTLEESGLDKKHIANPGRPLELAADLDAVCDDIATKVAEVARQERDQALRQAVQLPASDGVAAARAQLRSGALQAAWRTLMELLQGPLQQEVLALYDLAHAKQKTVSERQELASALARIASRAAASDQGAVSQRLQSDTPVMEVRGVEKQLGTRNGFTLSLLGEAIELRAGEVLGVLGANGSGKSTFLRVAAGRLAVDTGNVIHRCRHSLRELNHEQVHARTEFVGYGSQMWFGRLRRHAQLFSCMRVNDPKDVLKLVDGAIDRMGLRDKAGAPWSQLSDGMRIRARLAMARCWWPDFLVLDEPLAPLDEVAQHVLLNDLRQLAASRGVAVVLSSQEVHKIEAMADKILVLGDGRALYYGRPDDLPTLHADVELELHCTHGSHDVESVLRQSGFAQVSVASGGVVLAPAFCRDGSCRCGHCRARKRRHPGAVDAGSHGDVFDAVRAQCG